MVIFKTSHAGIAQTHLEIYDATNSSHGLFAVTTNLFVVTTNLFVLTTNLFVLTTNLFVLTTNLFVVTVCINYKQLQTCL